MENIDIVFHLAVACVRMSLNNPIQVHEVNATGTLNTLYTAKKHKVKHFIYVSSSEVYGTAKRPLMSETHPTDPTTVYGMSKLIVSSTRTFMLMKTVTIIAVLYLRPEVAF